MSPDNGPDPQLLRLAAAALRRAVAGDLLAATFIVGRLAEQYGGAGLWVAMLGWADTLLHHVQPGHEPGRAVALTFIDQDNGALVDADQTPSPQAWAGRLVAARLADDQGMWQALCDAVPEAERGTYVLTMLQLVAVNINRADDVGEIMRAQGLQ